MSAYAVPVRTLMAKLVLLVAVLLMPLAMASCDGECITPGNGLRNCDGSLRGPAPARPVEPRYFRVHNGMCDFFSSNRHCRYGAHRHGGIAGATRHHSPLAGTPPGNCNATSSCHRSDRDLLIRHDQPRPRCSRLTGAGEIILKYHLLVAASVLAPASPGTPAAAQHMHMPGMPMPVLEKPTPKKKQGVRQSAAKKRPASKTKSLSGGGIAPTTTAGTSPEGMSMPMENGATKSSAEPTRVDHSQTGVMPGMQHGEHAHQRCP